MFDVEMTPNLLGIKISGSYDDLDQLYDSIWDLCLTDGDYSDDAQKKNNAKQVSSIPSRAVTSS